MLGVTRLIHQPEYFRWDAVKNYRHEAERTGNIFTYAKRRWVVPSSHSSRHTGDMRVALQAASRPTTCTNRHKKTKSRQLIHLFSSLSLVCRSNYLNPLPLSTWQLNDWIHLKWQSNRVAAYWNDRTQTKKERPMTEKCPFIVTLQQNHPKAAELTFSVNGVRWLTKINSFNLLALECNGLCQLNIWTMHSQRGGGRWRPSRMNSTDEDFMCSPYTWGLTLSHRYCKCKNMEESISVLKWPQICCTVPAWLLMP